VTSWHNGKAFWRDVWHDWIVCAPQGAVDGGDILLGQAAGFAALIASVEILRALAMAARVAPSRR